MLNADRNFFRVQRQGLRKKLQAKIVRLWREGNNFSEIISNLTNQGYDPEYVQNLTFDTLREVE